MKWGAKVPKVRVVHAKHTRAVGAEFQHVWTFRHVILILFIVAGDGTLGLRLDTGTSSCRSPSLLVSAVAVDWNLFGSALLCCAAMKCYSVYHSVSTLLVQMGCYSSRS